MFRRFPPLVAFFAFSSHTNTGSFDQHCQYALCQRSSRAQNCCFCIYFVALRFTATPHDAPVYLLLDAYKRVLAHHWWYHGFPALFAPALSFWGNGQPETPGMSVVFSQASVGKPTSRAYCISVSNVPAGWQKLPLHRNVRNTLKISSGLENSNFRSSFAMERGIFGTPNFDLGTF